MINPTTALLMAQIERFRGLEERFGGRQARLDSGDVINGLMLLAVAAAGVAILAYVARKDSAGAFNRPWALFRELCKAHKLTLSQRRLLAKLARYHELKDPARLFLERDLLASRELPPQLAARSEEVAVVKEKLFLADDQRKAEPRHPSPRRPNRDSLPNPPDQRKAEPRHPSPRRPNRDSLPNPPDPSSPVEQAPHVAADRDVSPLPTP